jgi:threonine dehydrogenase-like Zn-dependent dehydrogenase
MDKVPWRLQFAHKQLGVEPVDINVHKDVCKRIYELVPEGLDVALACDTFHEPK